MAGVRASEKGRLVGNWRLEDPLGEGGFGAVYAAQHATILERRAAVKLLHPELARQPELRRRFLNEANAASRADHEHIVQIFDGGETADGVCFVVMELLRGSSLSHALEAGPMTLQRVVQIGFQVTHALAAAHRVGLVHRDLKPDNIFLVARQSNPDFVKVLDFGVAKLLDDERLTRTGMILGTPAYMAPEQWRCVPDLDGRADLYSLGVILFRCTTGALPFQGRTTFDFMDAHLHNPVPDPSVTRVMPRALAELIQQLLHKDRQARIQSAEEVGERLSRCLETTLKGSHSAPSFPPPNVAGTPPLVAAVPPTLDIPAHAYKSAPLAGSPHAARPQQRSEPSFIPLSLRDISIASRHLSQRLRRRWLLVAGVATALLGATLAGRRLTHRPSLVATTPPLTSETTATLRHGSEAATARAWECPEDMVALGPGRITRLPTKAREFNPRSASTGEIVVGRYAISKYEVSFAELRVFDAIYPLETKPWAGTSDDASQAALAVNQVTRNTAEQYCAWRYPGSPATLGSGRLPTAEEWIFAARSGRSDYQYPWGTRMNLSHVNWRGARKDSATLMPARSLPSGQSVNGVFHLLGNVAEWIAKDPHTPRGDTNQGTVCGGSVISKSEAELSATCINHRADQIYRDVGFRCVLSLRNN